MNFFNSIIFDMDGTLVNSEIVWRDAETEMLKARGIIYTEEIRQQVLGLRSSDFFEKLIYIYKLNETLCELENELLERMLEKVPLIQAKPGAQEIIEYAFDIGIPYCIASSSPLPIIKAVMYKQGWKDLMQKLYTAESVSKGKPAPDVYLYAAAQLGVLAQDAIAIEDSPNGAKSAVAAQMTCYVVPDLQINSGAFKEITPHVFSSLYEVLASLKQQRKRQISCILQKENNMI
jgi:beta-phosphoglucomutase-like phosphatase (HAD superfamily)